MRIKPLRKLLALDPALARVARYLRLFGLDTLCEEAVSGSALVERARAEGRLLVTESSICIGETDPRQQLTAILRESGHVERVLEGEGFLTICLECNRELLPVGPHHVALLVSGRLLQQYDEFRLCPRCSRVYWDGDQWKLMREWVRAALQSKA